MWYFYSLYCPCTYNTTLTALLYLVLSVCYFPFAEQKVFDHIQYISSCFPCNNYNFHSSDSARRGCIYQMEIRIHPYIEERQTTHNGQHKFIFYLHDLLLVNVFWTWISLKHWSCDVNSNRSILHPYVVQIPKLSRGNRNIMFIFETCL